MVALARLSTDCWPSTKTRIRLQRKNPANFVGRHATARLRSRGIELDETAQSEISAAVDQLAGKGAKESLVLYDEHAFIVGVQRRTVITAMTLMLMLIMM